VRAFDHGGDGEEGVREHGQDAPAVPGGPAPHLMLVQAGEAFGVVLCSYWYHCVASI
jgi:hypothetical protein